MSTRAFSALRVTASRLAAQVDASTFGTDVVYERSTLSTNITTGAVTRTTTCAIACRARQVALTMRDLQLLAQQGPALEVHVWEVDADVLRLETGLPLEPRPGDFVVVGAVRYRLLHSMLDMPGTRWHLITERVG